MAERINNFEMATLHHQKKRQMSCRYYFGCGRLAFLSNFLCFISGEAIMLWMIEHCVFAYDSHLKNNESVTAVRREFWHHCNIYQNKADPPIRQSYNELMHFTQQVH